MELKFDKGIFLTDNNTKLYLDPETTKVPIRSGSLISHSHSDHTAGLASDAISFSTAVTETVFHTLFPRRLRNNKTVEFNEPFDYEGFEIEFLPAGHLLGAAQARITYGDTTILFTGDFCPESLLTVPEAKFPKEKVDVLVIETTYGNPSVKFRSREENRLNILNWVMQTLSKRAIPVLNVAHLGGAQELIKMFNQLTDLPIFVHPKIDQISKIYNEHGAELEYDTIANWTQSNGSLILLPRSEKHVPSKIASESYSRGIVTGQSAKYGFRKFEFSAPLTTHATCQELLETVSRISPKMVITRYSYEQQFADLVQERLNIPAVCSKTLMEKELNLDELPTNTLSKENMSLLQFLD